jgi:hypothetical protein|tara:strand:+ start:848 stop:1528 length:681 start_codon:yes stop_codon:yes gene_type:complete
MFRSALQFLVLFAFSNVSCSEHQEPLAEGGQVASNEDPEISSLRDRVKITKAPPPKPSFWSQAVTLEERQAKIEALIEAEPEVYVVDLHDMGGWEFNELLIDPFPDYIRQLDGKEVITRGFMMPDIDFEHIQKFHLVRSLFACCFGAPPQLNEIVRVTLLDEKGMDYTYNTVEIRGTLRVVFEMEDGLVEDLFRIENATYKILDFDDPGAPVDFDETVGFDGVIPM